MPAIKRLARKFKLSPQAVGNICCGYAIGKRDREKWIKQWEEDCSHDLEVLDLANDPISLGRLGIIEKSPILGRTMLSAHWLARQRATSGETTR